MRGSLLMAALLLALSGEVYPASATAETRTPGATALDLSARVEGEGYKELSARWWQWVNSFPGDVVPYRDPDGRLCDINQAGPVWFLAGTDGNGDVRRHCVVPSGRHVFLPIINMYAHDRGSTGSKAVCKRLRRSVAVNNDALRSAVILIDGELLPEPRNYRVRSDCFDPFPFWKKASGLVAASDGYWLLLPPLSPGRHVISVGANYATDDGEKTFGQMLQNFEYELEIGGPSI